MNLAYLDHFQAYFFKSNGLSWKVKITMTFCLDSIVTLTSFFPLPVTGSTLKSWYSNRVWCWYIYHGFHLTVNSNNQTKYIKQLFSDTGHQAAQNVNPEKSEINEASLVTAEGSFRATAHRRGTLEHIRFLEQKQWDQESERPYSWEQRANHLGAESITVVV